MDALIRRLASPQAMSTSTLAVTFLFFVIGTSAVISFTSTNATLADLLFSGALSILIFAAIFLSRAPLNRLGNYRRRAAGVVAVVVAANLLRILALDFHLNELEVAGTRTLLTRLTSATFITLIGMIVVGELAYRRARFAGVMATLTEQSEALSLTMTADADRLKKATDELEASIRTTLDPVLSIVTRVVSSAPPDKSSLTGARLIKDILQLSVRPMIEALAEPPAVERPARLEPIVSTSPASAWQGTIDIRDSIRPLLGVVPFRLIGFPFIFAILPPGPALRALLILTLTWPMLSAVRKLWPDRYCIMPIGRGVLALNLTYLVTVGLPVLLFIVVSLPFMSDTLDAWKVASLFLWATSFFVANAWFASSVFILERSRRLTEEQLIEVNHQIELSIARMRQRIWFARRNLTWVLHGPVQSALVSAALRLESGDDLGPEERLLIQENIMEAYSRLNSNGADYPDFAKFCTRLARVWSGICEIEVCDPGALIGHLAHDLAGAASLIEIATESASNAIRHGNATSLTITVSKTRSGVVTLTITDNGTGMRLGSRLGIGSTLYDSLAQEWSLTGSPDGTTLTAHIPWTPDGLEPASPLPIRDERG